MRHIDVSGQASGSSRLDAEPTVRVSAEASLTKVLCQQPKKVIVVATAEVQRE